ncbi:MAG: SRPBCC family protein [Actinobacteria bacterium]|nr:SRPBCC family protein [Actinomycetota bacterium]
MDLNHQFTVNVPIAEAWVILTDLERIAPCLPGAQLTEVEGDTYRGQVKIKVGPILAQFKGQASFVSRDDVAHKATLKGEGRDTTGKGNASALITAELTSVSPTSTTCTVHTDLTISGKVAQFGRGALADVSDKLLAQFSENLNQLITGAPAPSTPTTAAAAPAATSAPTPAPSEQPAIRIINSPEVAPLDLLETAGAPILKRAIPALIAVVAVVAALVYIF